MKTKEIVQKTGENNIQLDSKEMWSKRPVFVLKHYPKVLSSPKAH